MEDIVTTRLSCGATLVCERIVGVRSAALRILLPVGDASDPADLDGRATLWSELLLRGSAEHDSRSQADAFDRLGASRSCSNGRRFVSFGTTALGERLGDVIPLVADSLLRPAFGEASVEAAKALAVQAIESLEDDPQQRTAVAARRRHFAAPLNRSGYGDADHIGAATAERLRTEWHESAKPGGAVISAAGAVDPESLRAALDDAFASWEGDCASVEASGEPERGYGHIEDESNQVQVMVVHDAPAERDDAAFAERMLSTVLSGGMSCRLFTEVREKRGLCYHVSARYKPEREFGSVTAYVGTTPERAQEALDVLVAELRRVSEAGGEITEDEYARAKTGLTSSVVFSGESTAARASALASDMIKIGRARSIGDLTDAIEAVTLEGLRSYAAGRDLGRLTVQTLGPGALNPPTGM